ncbi:RRS1-domain-containing protein [Lentinula edodes]|uniref:Ribosome biogenesis regulatory protein n=1 Tax=Lentinula edodes TaxID=5353 RepID=A0A1Q3E212_LENED|nr:RRS1-domain-containing protein [Lentinula edodes]KAJ3902778.1 RRS1-domain-containing protein [Lentinula edodes]GAW01079.1 RRS1-domain-containing protein [Lentinula edodes]
MDVSNILADHAEKIKSTEVETDTPLDVDAGFLTVTDPNPIDGESYESSLETHLLSLARTGTQALLNALFSLPTTSSPDGPLAQLPAPTTQLPRTKPLPKIKPLTKWEQFAKAKGIQGKSKEKREKKVWDEERQEWINRWGKDAKNKQVEEQWITEVPMNADIDFDPRKAARDERKARVTKNQKQHEANAARAQKTGSSASSNPEREAHKKDLERTLAMSRTSTASMGKFDRKLEGEKKMKGIKRKFDPTEGSVSAESKAALDLLSKMNSDARKTRMTEAQRPSKKSRTSHGGNEVEDPEGKVLNVRKAVRFASKGRGGAALGREREKAGKLGKSGKGKRR